MGCWNETCALTRTPILAGMPVVALTTVRGPYYKGSDGINDTALLFGFPLKGKYDDYGGVEDIENAVAEKLTEHAFGKTGLYREVRTKRSYGAASSHWLACSPDTLWGLEHSMRHVFNHEHGVKPSDWNSSEEVARNRAGAAFTACSQALEQLGKNLAACELPEDEGAFFDALFDQVALVFGSDKAWPAYQTLQSKGLFATQGTLLMHRAAYEAMVAEFGSRKVYYYGQKEHFALREFLGKELDSWLTLYQEVQGQREQSSLPSESRQLLRGMQLRNDYLKPLTQPWKSSEVPLESHYWGGASVDEVLQAHSRDELLDFFVFQWASHYLRVDLKPSAGGSQNGETRLHQKVMRAAYAALKEDGSLKTDFYGCIHRR